MKSYLKISVLSLGLQLLWSCADDNMVDNINRHPKSCQLISYNISAVASTADDLVPTAKSRGAEITTVLDFAVSCYVNKNDELATNPEFLYFTQEEYSGDGTIFESSSGNEYYWLDDTYDYYFYAYAPLAVENREFTDTKYSVFNYSVPTNANEQVDLLAYFATTKQTSDSEPNAFYEYTVSLPFRHILSEISIVQGNDMASGKIYSISLSGLHGAGQYDISHDKWTIIDKADKSFTLNLTNNGTGTDTSASASLSGTNGNFFMLPQSTQDMKMTIVYAGEDGTKKTYTKSLTANWEKGKKYTYTLTINPEAEIVILDSEIVQDAHYVLMKDEAAITINLKNLPEGRRAILSAIADDGAVVTMQLESDLNMMARQGYWTDYYYANGSQTNESARGSRDGKLSDIHNGDKIAVFLPENIGSNSRTITFNLYLEGSSTILATKTITQLCPAWTGNSFGWEQRQDDNKGAYGFSWNRLISYQLVYSSDKTFGSSREDYCNSVIQENKTWTNDNFAKTQRFRYSIINYRYCITLDYSALNTDVATDRNDGLKNTKTLYKNAGGATTAAFETILENIKKTEEGHETENAFRQMSESDLYSGSTSVYGPQGENVTGSDAIAQILKKNRYHIQRTTTTEGNNQYTQYSPVLLESDIVWFLPAVDQFSIEPDYETYPYCEKIDGSSWTSTGIEGTATSYLGDGSAETRTEVHTVRASRTQ